MNLRYIAALFLVLSGVLCELKQSQGSQGSESEVPQNHQAEGCCMDCDGTLSPLKDLPACSWIWFAKCDLGLSVDGAVGVSLP